MCEIHAPSLNVWNVCVRMNFLRKKTYNQLCCQRSGKWTNQSIHISLHQFFSPRQMDQCSWWKSFLTHEYKVRVGDVFTSCEFIQYIPKLFHKLWIYAHFVLKVLLYFVGNVIFIFISLVTFCDGWLVIFAPCRAWIAVEIISRSQWIYLQSNVNLVIQQCLHLEFLGRNHIAIDTNLPNERQEQTDTYIHTEEW